MDFGKVVRDWLRRDQVVSVLTVGEIFVRQVGSECLVRLVAEPIVLCLLNSPQPPVHLPSHDDLVIDTVQLHVLQTPTFVDPSRYQGLSESSKVWCVVHAHFHPLGAKLFHKSGQKSRT